MTGNELLEAICTLASPEPEPVYVGEREDRDQVADLAERMGMEVASRPIGTRWRIERRER